MTTIDRLMTDKDAKEGAENVPDEPKLEFTNLHADAPYCDCVKDLCTDVESVFIRECDGRTLREKDFETQWERFIRQGKKEKLATEEPDICGQKGVSVSPNLAGDTPYILYIRDRYKRYPDRKPWLHYLKLTNKCGFVKNTPQEHDPNHHDIYKSDSFDWTKVVVVTDAKHAKDV